MPAPRNPAISAAGEVPMLSNASSPPSCPVTGACCAGADHGGRIGIGERRAAAQRQAAGAALKIRLRRHIAAADRGGEIVEGNLRRTKADDAVQLLRRYRRQHGRARGIKLDAAAQIRKHRRCEWLRRPRYGLRRARDRRRCAEDRGQQRRHVERVDGKLAVDAPGLADDCCSGCGRRRLRASVNCPFTAAPPALPSSAVKFSDIAGDFHIALERHRKCRGARAAQPAQIGARKRRVSARPQAPDRQTSAFRRRRDRNLHRKALRRCAGRR